MFAGRVPSLFVLGTVNWRSTVSPRRSAARSAGATGSFTSGGSGGPFLPQLAHSRTTINAETAEPAEKNLPCEFRVFGADRRSLG
jgi:hypothetical protein